MKTPWRNVIERACAGVCVESLESRQLLSASALVLHPHHEMLPSFVGATAQAGYTPDQARRAYGFDRVGGDGSGQTIAIVDAYKNANIAGDLDTFDARFGLAAPPSLTIVSQIGGPVTSVRSNGPWASEIALDVEWAHAIAPNANLLLVETNTDTIPDLMAGVDYARNVAGVSVVSLSWGGGEFRGQRRYDPMLATPGGHAGITFVAAAGDVGSSHGPNWPSSSGGVLSVGGTTMYTKDLAGDYSTEVGWRDVTGGVSRYEAKPSFQFGVTGGSTRSTPDVSYAADPALGFSVYSSINDGGIVGWSVIAGTSAGTAQWSAQVAIADQLRAGVGKASLDGSQGTMPALYKLYSPPNSANYSSYAADFNDIATGRSSRCRAAAGYDCVTGLGTPKAPQIVAALVAAGTPAAAPASVAMPSAERAHHLKPSAMHPSDHQPDPVAEPPRANDRNLTRAPHRRSSSAALARASSASDAILPIADASWVSPVAGIRVAVEGSRAISLVPAASSSQRFDLPPTVSLTLNHPATPRARVFTGAVELLAVSMGSAEAPTATILDIVTSPGGASGRAVPAGPHSALAQLLDFDQPQSLSSFSDAMSEFAYESALLGGAAFNNSHTRAWAVTFAVLGVDAVLLGWRRASVKYGRRTSKKHLEARKNSFSLSPI